MNISGKVSNTRQEKLCILAYRNNTTDRFVSTKQNLARLNLLTYLFINWSDINFVHLYNGCQVYRQRWLQERWQTENPFIAEEWQFNNHRIKPPFLRYLPIFVPQW